MKSKCGRGFLRDIKEQIKANKKVFAVWASLRLIVFAALVLAALRQDYESVFICILTLILFIIPTFIQKSLSLQFPTTLQIVILLHIFAAEILGELRAYYIHFPYWDIILHTVWGFLCAAVGYSLVDILNEDNSFHFKLSPLYLAIVSFCFSMTIGVMWEFFEFAADNILMLDMQKDTVRTWISSVTLDETHSNIPIIVSGIDSVIINGQELGVGGYLDIGLYDTMGDLLVNFLGALVFSVIGYFSSKKGSNSRFAFHFIPRLKEKDAES